MEHGLLRFEIRSRGIYFGIVGLLEYIKDLDLVKVLVNVLANYFVKIFG